MIFGCCGQGGRRRRNHKNPISARKHKFITGKGLSMVNAKIAVIWLSSLRMKSPEPVHVVKKPLTTIGKIMGAGNSVHLLHLIREIFVPNLKGRKTDFTDIVLRNNGFNSDWFFP